MVSGVHWGFWEGLNTLLFMMHLEHCPGTWYMLYYWHWCCWSCLKVKVLVAQSCPALCNPMGCSPPGSSVPRILQAGILEWVAIPFSRGSSWPRDQTPHWVSHIAGRFFTIWTTEDTPETMQARMWILRLWIWILGLIVNILAGGKYGTHVQHHFSWKRHTHWFLGLVSSLL